GLLAFVIGELLLFSKGILDRGHVAYADLTAIGVAAHNDLAQTVCSIRFSQGTYQDATSRGFDFARREVEIGAPDGRRDLTEGQVELLQLFRVDADSQFSLPRANAIDRRDRCTLTDVVFNFIGDMFQTPLARLAI